VKKGLEKIYLNRLLIVFAISIVAFVFFHVAIQDIIDFTLVNPLLSKVQSNAIKDAAFLIITIGFLGYYYNSFKKVIISKEATAVIIFVLAIYLYYRISENYWTLTPLALIPYIKYTDIIIVIGFSNLLIFIKNLFWDKPFKAYSSDLYIDEPKENDDDNDILGYKSYATVIAEKIRNNSFNTSFAIGINAKWGAGKTTFINFIKKTLEKDKIIFVNFNPWSSNTQSSLIIEFFNVLNEAIRPYNSSLARLLLFYSQQLVSMHENTVTRGIHSLTKIFLGQDSVSSTFNSIKRSLEVINKKIVIVIDDVDRLHREEIVEVIRLIRNTANFNNLYFLVAYDRNYVVNALKDHNSLNNNEFLEKIFQLEINLPTYNKSIILESLFNTIKENCDELYWHELRNEIIGNEGLKPEYLYEWLENMRDVTRLANALSVNFIKLTGEVNIGDFIKLELIRIKYPSVYTLLHTKTRLYFTVHSSSSGQYQFREVEKVNDKFKDAQSELELYLLLNQDKLNINQFEIVKIIDILETIFSSHLIGISKNQYLSVTNPLRFGLYFRYILQNGTLSELTFIKARSSNQIEFNQQISAWVNEGIQNQLKVKFDDINEFADKEDFEKVIRAIIHLATQTSKFDGIYLDNLVWYDEEKLIYLLTNESKIKDLYDSRGENFNYKKFLIKLFDDAKYPYTYEYHVIDALIKSHDIWFPLTAMNLYEKWLEYLKAITSDISSFNKNAYYMYYNFKDSINYNLTKVVNNGMELIENAKKITIKYIGDTFEESLIILFQRMLRDNAQYSFNANLILDLFESWENFDEFVESKKENDSEILNEFREFHFVSKKLGHGKFIPFKFNHIIFDKA
jgi:hypothetical protein